MTWANDNGTGDLRRIVDELRGLHLRVSLFAFRATGEDSGALEPMLRESGERLGFVAPGPKETVLFLFVAPRPSGERSLRESDATLCRKMVDALLRPLPRGGTGIEARVVHRWMDEVFDLDSLLAELDAMPAPGVVAPGNASRTAAAL